MSAHSTQATSILAGDLFSRTYIVPLYQREYAWGQEEIRQLLDDLWEAFKADQNRNYHLGSLTVFPRSGVGTQPECELIDGQQRTITLALFLRLLSNGPLGLSGRLRFENRPEAEVFLAAFDANPTAAPLLPRTFYSAVNTMLGHEVFGEECRHQRKSFAEYIHQHVILFLITMPPETDVSAYFEIMNNRGVQLEFHDLLKAQLIAKLSDGYDKVLFDKLWTACADMNGVFLDRLPKNIGEMLSIRRSWTALSALPDSVPVEQGLSRMGRSIIPDFPNFLLHVLRVYLKKDATGSDFTLDERQMRTIFKERLDKIVPADFLDCLLQTRMRFDRLVVKSVSGDAGEDIQWQIKDAPAWSLEDRERLTHLESMLQVSFPSRRGKKWLSELLCADTEDVQSLIELLEGFARKHLQGQEWLCRGTGTPHLALNLIDYLMYCANPSEYRGDKAFRFAYRNSVEHHFPQGNENEDWTKECVDDIGNLYLLAGAENSALNVRNPLDKVSRAGNADRFPPKRREIYRITKAHNGWTPQLMKDHSVAVQNLLNSFLVLSP